MRANYRKVLERLELFANDDQLPISIKLTSKHICISYDELKLKSISDYLPIRNKLAAIDMNPNYIGLTIDGYENKLYNLSKLTVKSGEESSSDKSKYLNNKLDFGI